MRKQNRFYQTTLNGFLSVFMGAYVAGCAAQQPQPEPSAKAETKTEKKAATEPDATNANELYLHAERQEREGQEEKALAYYLQATQVDPNHLKSHIALAQLYTKFNRHEEAKVAYENIIRLDRENPFVVSYKDAKLKYLSALNIAQNAEYEKAMALLEQAPKNTPFDPEIEETKQKWRKAMQGDKSRKIAEDIIQQASLLAYKGKYTQAIELIKTAPTSEKDEEVVQKIALWEKSQKDQEGKSLPLTPKPSPQSTSSAAPTHKTTGITKYIVADNVNVRQSPYLYSPSIAAVAKGTAVEVLSEKAYESDGYHWSKIRTASGTEGWVAAQFLNVSLTSTPSQSPPAPVVKVGKRQIKGSNVNLRQSPSTRGALVTQLSQGHQVFLLSMNKQRADGHDWYQIQTSDGKVGWVSSAFLSNPAAAAAPAVKKNTISSARFVKGANVNLRAKPSSGAQIVKLLSGREHLVLLDAQGVKRDGLVWYHVRLDSGTHGWLASQFISAQAGAERSASAAPVTRYIKGDRVNIRAQASPSAKIIHVGRAGTKLLVLSTGKIQNGGYTWVKVKLPDGQVGWVVADYIR